jgi:RHS repeat-associated protein
MKTSIPRGRSTPLLLLILLAGAPLAEAYYDPGIQRWINRDPINEVGFEVFKYPKHARKGYYGHDYAYVQNAPTSYIDPLGLLTFGKTCTPVEIAELKRQAAERCKKAKEGDCYRCLDPKARVKMQQACDSKDGAGPKVECEDQSNSRCVAKARGQADGWTDSDGTMHICMNANPGCGFIHELGHSVGGVGSDGPFTPNPDNRGYAIAKCAGCPIPSHRDNVPGY